METKGKTKNNKKKVIEPSKPTNAKNSKEKLKTSPSLNFLIFKKKK